MKPRFDIHLGPADLARALADDVTRGLTSTPKELPPKWFYDELGCKLFDEITGLPEYYPTRRERAILRDRAAEVVELSGADTLVELGSGTSEKTRILLDAFAGGGAPLHRFIPFDVSEPTLRQASEAIAAHFPRIEVHAVVGDFEHHVGRLPRGGRRLVAFLGGTIGNLKPDGRARLLESLASTMSAGDTLLLGTDLVKDASRLVAAYDDSAGVSAAFNRNVLSVINRELNADFVTDRFTHVARFDTANEWMEMSLRADGAQAVTIADLGLRVDFADGEEMRTEISAKFRRPGVEAELEAAGMSVVRWWTDPAGDFALSLSRRA